MPKVAIPLRPPPNMATTTTTTTTAPADQLGTGTAVPPARAADKRVVQSRAFKFGPLAPLLMLLGTLLWLVGSALFIGSQSRLSIPLLSTSPINVYGSGAIINSGLRTATWILWIIAAAFWIVGALLYVLRTMAMAALSAVRMVDGRPRHAWQDQEAGSTTTTTTKGTPMMANPMRGGTGTTTEQGGSRHTPGIARWAVLGSWMQLLATVLVLIGVAVWSAGDWGGVSAGAIIILVGFTLWALAMLVALGTSFVTISIVKHIPDFRQRKYAWNAFLASLFQTVQFILFGLASVTLVVRDPAGLWLASGLLFLTGAVYGTWGWIIAMRGATVFMGPLFGYTTAAYCYCALDTPGVGGAKQQPSTQLATDPVQGGVGSVTYIDRTHDKTSMTPVQASGLTVTPALARNNLPPPATVDLSGADATNARGPSM